MRTGITVDDSLWPMLLSRFSGAVSDEQFDEYLRRGTANLQRGELYVTVLEMGSMHLPTTAQRQRQTVWMKIHGRALREQLLGTAFVITSPIIRLGLSTLFHIVPQPVPYIVVPDLDTGVRWALRRLEAGGRTEEARHIRERLGVQEGHGAPPT